MAAENLREKLRVQGILGLAGVLIIVGGAYGAFDAYLLAAVIVTLVVIAAISLVARAWMDAALALGLAASYFGARFVFPDLDAPTSVLRTSAINAYLLLHATLLIGPWSWWSRLVMRLYKHRRHVGVAAFLSASMHFGIVLRTYYGGSLADAFSAVFTYFGFTGLYFMAFLAVTSRDHLQKHVHERTWQFLHLGMLAGYAALTAWMLSLQRGIPIWATALPFVFLTFGLLVMRNPFTKRAVHRVWGWKQMHLMVYVVYASVVQHVWAGVVQYQGLPLQIALWALVALVVGSHAAGLIGRWRQDREARLRVVRLGRELSEGGLRYVAVAKDADFAPRVGQKFFVAGNPVAVFKLSDRYLAVSNVCAHQKGPLYKGSFNAAGHLVCPWHGWEYSVKDGCGPPAFRKDCVPFYPTLVRDGHVYVATERAPLPPDVPKPSRAAGDVP